MDKKDLNDLLARRFLLGQLSPEEQGSVEELAFEDPDAFAYIQAAQDELIDDFVYDELSADEKTRFREYFLVQPGRRQNIRIARALQQYLSDDQIQPTNVVAHVAPARVSSFYWLRPYATTRALVTAALILAAAVGLLLAIRAIRRSDNPPLEAKQQEAPALPTPSSSPTSTLLQTTPSPPVKDDQNIVSPTPQTPVVAFLLEPGAPGRSQGVEQTIPLPSGPISLELPIIDDTPYRRYQVVLQTGGEIIRRWSNRQPKELQAGRGVNVIVPVGVLKKSQRYRVTVEGVAADGNTQLLHNYHFGVN